MSFVPATLARGSASGLGSLVSLLAANAVTIAVALIQGWPLGPLMWIYWWQSVVIGIFNFMRILSLRGFTTDGLKMNGRPVAPTRASQQKVALFFLLHYGLFHVGYAVFLAVEQRIERGDRAFVLLCSAVFLVNHFFSYRYNLERDTRRLRNLGTLMFFPYARILPLHLTIVLGACTAPYGLGLLLFLALKTAADAVMHLIEHRMDRVPRSRFARWSRRVARGGADGSVTG